MGEPGVVDFPALGSLPVEDTRLRLIREHIVVIAFAIIALCIVVARAWIQSITIDEAASYLLFASPLHAVTHWYPSSGNHVLNSILMRLVTSVFGISELSVRIPAIIGAAVYISSVVYICLLLKCRKLVEIPLVICLLFNPIVLDYAVAARGYSLAIGFMLAAIACMAGAMLQPDFDVRMLRRRCVWASVFLALSFAANFSFAIADGVTMLTFYFWAARRDRWPSVAARCFLPGLAVAFLVCGSVVLDWPKGQLYFGSTSLWELWNGLRNACFDELNPDVLNPLLLAWLNRIESVLPYIVVVTAASLVIAVERSHRESRNRAFMRLLVSIAVVTMMLHYVAFIAWGLLLPKDRTALFFVPVLMLAFGAAIVIRFESVAGKDPLGYWALGVLICMAVCFIGTLRLGYFREWKFDADTRALYWLANDIHRRCGVAVGDIATDWRYHVSLNFYRAAYGNQSIPEFSGFVSESLPADKMAYVLFLPASKEFIERQHLRVIYHDGVSGSVVAIRGCPAEQRIQ